MGDIVPVARHFVTVWREEANLSSHYSYLSLKSCVCECSGNGPLPIHVMIHVMTLTIELNKIFFFCFRSDVFPFPLLLPFLFTSLSYYFHFLVSMLHETLTCQRPGFQLPSGPPRSHNKLISPVRPALRFFLSLAWEWRWSHTAELMQVSRPRNIKCQ